MAQADELAAAGVADEDEEADLESSESATSSEGEGEEEDDGTSAKKKPKKQAILKPPTAKQKPGKVGAAQVAAVPGV